MVDNNNNILLERKNKHKRIVGDLLIVDIQDKFSTNFLYSKEEYINKVKEYCVQFDRVYQIWDNYEGDIKPTYIFPKEVRKIEKKYGIDLDNIDITKFNPEVTERFITKQKNNSFVLGDKFPTMNGELIVYVGNKHLFFHCNKELLQLFLYFLRIKRPLYIIGGLRNLCLYDIYITAKSIGLKLNLNKELIYG